MSVPEMLSDFEMTTRAFGQTNRTSNTDATK